MNITKYKLKKEKERLNSLFSVPRDLSNLVIKVTNKSLVFDTEIAKIHTTGADTTLGTMAANVAMGTHKLTGLSIPASAGDSIRATAKITEALLESATDLKHAAVTVSAPISLSTQAISLVNNAVSPATVTAIDIDATVAGNSETFFTATTATEIYTDTKTTLAAVKADADVASAISLKHTAGTDTALGAVGTKNPPIDADKALYRDSTVSDALVTSTWTQVKAFLKTYFDSLYVIVSGALGTPSSGVLTNCTNYPGLAITAGKTITTTENTSLDEAVAMSDKLTIPGAWTTPAFDAANFTASGSMTWTVEAADVKTFSYLIIGKTMFLTVKLENTTVGGTPDTVLYIKIPESKLAAKGAYGPYLSFDNNVGALGMWRTGAGIGNIYLYRNPAGDAWSAVTNAACVYVSITVEIN